MYLHVSQIELSNVLLPFKPLSADSWCACCVASNMKVPCFESKIPSIDEPISYIGSWLVQNLILILKLFVYNISAWPHDVLLLSHVLRVKTLIPFSSSRVNCALYYTWLYLLRDQRWLILQHPRARQDRLQEGDAWQHPDAGAVPTSSTSSTSSTSTSTSTTTCTSTRTNTSRSSSTRTGTRAPAEPVAPAVPAAAAADAGCT